MVCERKTNKEYILEHRYWDSCSSLNCSSFFEFDNEDLTMFVRFMIQERMQDSSKTTV